MTSHAPFLAVRPDEQFSTQVKPRLADLVDMADSPLPPDSPAPLTRVPRSRMASRVPRSLRFPLVAVTSLGINALVRSLTANISGFQFAPASRDPNVRPELVGYLVAAKVAELGVAWAAGYDYEDLAALSLLTNQPYYYLLYSFWSVQLLPIVASLSIDLAAIAIPFALLRPRPALHEARAARSVNQRLAQDWQIILLTAILAACVYAVTFSLFYFLDLGVFLISHFDNIPSLESAHENNIPKMLALFAASGFGAMMFLFRPTLAAAGKPSLIESKAKGRKVRKFNPETATLGETLAHNFGLNLQLSHRADVLLERAIVLVGCTIANTVVRVWGTVQGTDLVGSLGYAGLWALAHSVVGVVYAWLGNEQ